MKVWVPPKTAAPKPTRAAATKGPATVRKTRGRKFWTPTQLGLQPRTEWNTPVDAWQRPFTRTEERIAGQSCTVWRRLDGGGIVIEGLRRHRPARDTNPQGGQVRVVAWQPYDLLDSEERPALYVAAGAYCSQCDATLCEACIIATAMLRRVPRESLIRYGHPRPRYNDEPLPF